MIDRQLTPQQKLFVDAYLATLSNTKAAETAGYKTPKQAGSRVRNYPQVAMAIAAGLDERVMGGDEVLIRLAEQARAEYAQFIDELGTVDLAEMRKQGKLHLIKRITPTKYGNSIEFYDAQAALLNIGRHHALFTDKTDLSATVDITEHEQAEQRINSRLDSIAERIRAKADAGGDSADGGGSETA